METPAVNLINTVLPHEIVCNVFTYLKPADLAIASLVCKHLRALASSRAHRIQKSGIIPALFHFTRFNAPRPN